MKATEGGARRCIETITDKPRPGVSKKEREATAYQCTKPVRGDGVLCVLHERNRSGWPIEQMPAEATDDSPPSQHKKRGPKP